MRRSPTGIATLDAPRLACVKPIASVHPEPGSNSPLFKLFFLSYRAQNPKYILFLYFRKLTVLFSCTTSCFTCKSYKDRFLFLCTPRTLSKNNTLSFFYPITESVTGCKDKNKFLFEPNLFESFLNLFSQTLISNNMENPKKEKPKNKSFLITLCSRLPSRKRVQKYGISPFPTNIL